MIKHFRLSLISTVTLLTLSSAGFAAQHHHANYKGEDFKGEAPVQQTYPVQPAVVTTVCAKDHCLSDGAYIGIGAGYDGYKAKQTSTGSSDVGVATSINPSLSVTGWAGSIFAGYGNYFDRFYFGGELNGNLSNAEQSYQLNTGTAIYNNQIRVRQSFSASLIPGVKLNDSTLLYGRVGYLRSNVKINESESAPGAATTSSADTKWVNGVDYGVGIESLVAENTSIRGEYTYTNYNSLTTNFGSKYKLTNNQFTLGLIYHFA